MVTKVQIKGIREGLLVILPEGEWDAVSQEFLDTLNQQGDFFKGARLYLDVGNQVLHAVELSRLRDAISERGLALWGVLSGSPVTQNTAQVLGLATRLSKPAGALVNRLNTPPETTFQDGESAIFVRRTLRSGYSLRYPGHVIVMGDVNPGAEIVAGGNVIVWGRLRGVVHAGAEGNDNAIICALDLSPMQLRISNQIATPLKKKANILQGKFTPEIARIENDAVITETWNPGKK